MKDIRFVSRNEFKLEEARNILSGLGVDVISLTQKIEELQTVDTNHLVRDKALKAFKLVGRPLFVEHTGLYLSKLNDFPGGLTQIFWDTLDPEKFSRLFADEKEIVRAVTTVCFIDGKKCHFFEGQIEGYIVNPPRVDYGFQWDCVFQPKGFDKTFSQMGEQKNEISMRRKALEQLAEHIGGMNDDNSG